MDHPRADDHDHTLEVERLGDVAAAYLRAAAALAVASVALRVSCSYLGDVREVGDEERFDRLIGRAVSALEDAASEHEAGVDLLSRTSWGTRPDMSDHMESMRLAVRVLNTQAVLLTTFLSDFDPDRDQVGDEGELGDGAPDELSPWYLLEDRAETFDEKVSLMTESARVLLDAAHRLAAGREEPEKREDG